VPARWMRRRFQPFEARARGTIVGVVLTFALVAALSATLSIWATSRSKNRAAVVETAGRQRTLAERYVNQVLLVRAGTQADPARTGSLLARSTHVLLDGGTAPAVEGDDDETTLSAATDPVVRAQLEQEQRLVTDLTATGAAVLAQRPVSTLPLTAGERIEVSDPVQRLRILAALTSNVSLNTARTIAESTDRNIADLITIQIALGFGGLVVSLLLAWALVAATRRQTAHFRSLVTSSTDLVLVFDAKGCRYVSQSVTAMLGRPETELLGNGFFRFVHEDDRPTVQAVHSNGKQHQLVFRMLNSAGQWRHLDAHLTDLRHDRHIRGVVVNARDISERVVLEQELAQQVQRDSFGTQLVEALEMADEEEATFDVVERAMVEVAAESPMELLLSDSSRANLERAAESPTSGAPACPVQSPFSCVAVRRGNPVVFESSEALNACPKLRDRPDGPCSAVCVPVSFMGRALGVLHTTGPEGNPLGAEQVAQLTTLATQAGARIGTVRAFEKTQLQASTDGLTGLSNRRTLEGHLRAFIREGQPFALAIADLDHFKQLNDARGHEAGDRALRVFAQVAQQTLRDDDIIARWGGEEFMIALPGLDQHQAVAVLERIRDSLSRAHTGGHPPFTASFGLTDSTRAETLEQLVHLADGGLYASKQGGRDRISIGDPSVDAQSLQAVPDRDALANGRRTRKARRRPALQDAAGEEDPQPSGLEIR
jgi:diguanylate cyclase (GGDEF)-like protein/PAS domain S-box-containing protein